jgi:hypothetical protein
MVPKLRDILYMITCYSVPHHSSDIQCPLRFNEKLDNELTSYFTDASFHYKVASLTFTPSNTALCSTPIPSDVAAFMWVSIPRRCCVRKASLSSSGISVEAVRLTSNMLLKFPTYFTCRINKGCVVQVTPRRCGKFKSSL